MLNVNRENLFEEMLQEPDEVAMKRKLMRERLHVLQQAFRVNLLLASACSNMVVDRINLNLYFNSLCCLQCLNLK